MGQYGEAEYSSSVRADLRLVYYHRWMINDDDGMYGRTLDWSSLQVEGRILS